MKRNFKPDVSRDMKGNSSTVLAEDKSTGKVAYKFTVERDAYSQDRKREDAEVLMVIEKFLEVVSG